ncbi:asialoglycoprotein receptor 1-like isoform X3 [Ctenopharyngodon idella]|uniref:asialoglycoprotein receptor 1-like isoform X3 n=1 Tax=Ctenopharyngodon idella TaxID=7959 RepID=UPI0022318A64|nr:asialoglycoprotein receptor 1-like isoform X3 [Ctenopharyngodon idella]
MDRSEGYIQMEMECEPKKSFRRDSNQERKFSVMESWMNSHTSDLNSVKSDFQITGSDLEKKVSEFQNLVSNLSSYLNMSGTSNTMANEVHKKKLSNIETLMADLGSSLSSLASKQEENQQKLENKQDLSHTEMKSLLDNLSFAVSALRSKLAEQSTSSAFAFLHSQHALDEMSSSLKKQKGSVEELKSLVQTLSYKLSLTSVLASGCIESDWIPFRNSCYLFSSDSMNWTQAKDYCEEQGALLLKLEDSSKKEWEFITVLAKPFPYWIGLTDQTTGQWRWADDTPCTVDKVHWGPGQPDEWQGHKQGGGEDCAHITINGNINDNHCAVKMRFICKGSKNS